MLQLSLWGPISVLIQDVVNAWRIQWTLCRKGISGATLIVHLYIPTDGVPKDSSIHLLAAGYYAIENLTLATISSWRPPANIEVLDFDSHLMVMGSKYEYHERLNITLSSGETDANHYFKEVRLARGVTNTNDDFRDLSGWLLVWVRCDSDI